MHSSLLLFLSCNFLILFKNHGYLKGFLKTETEMNIEGDYFSWKQNIEIIEIVQWVQTFRLCFYPHSKLVITK